MPNFSLHFHRWVVVKELARIVYSGMSDSLGRGVCVFLGTQNLLSGEEPTVVPDKPRSHLQFLELFSWRDNY